MEPRVHGRFKIGEAAQRLDTSERTLRFYEEEGLIEPLRTPRGTRLYSVSDIERGKVIQLLATAGASLREIRQIAHIRAESATGDEAGREVCRHLKTLRTNISAQKKRLQFLEREITRAEKAVHACFGCTLLPHHRSCIHCPVLKKLAQPFLLNLVLDPSHDDAETAAEKDGA